MDAPLCRLCEKRHYGTCAGAVVLAKLRARKKAKKAIEQPPLVPGAVELLDKPVPELVDAGIVELFARVESLEARVLELEKRKRYMREYQRAKRAEESGDEKDT